MFVCNSARANTCNFHAKANYLLKKGFKKHFKNLNFLNFNLLNFSVLDNVTHIFGFQTSF